MLHELVLLALTNVYFASGKFNEFSHKNLHFITDSWVNRLFRDAFCIEGSSVDYRGSIYELITEQNNHSQARQTCQNRSMDLAVISDEDENAFVYGLIR